MYVHHACCVAADRHIENYSALPLSVHAAVRSLQCALAWLLATLSRSRAPDKPNVVRSGGQEVLVPGPDTPSRVNRMVDFGAAL